MGWITKIVEFQSQDDFCNKEKSMQFYERLNDKEFGCALNDAQGK